MKRVLLGMSGGVDSSVAAIILMEQGYEVIGATMKLWDPEDETGQSKCCGDDSILDAKRVCDKLGIPHYTLNLKEEFKTCVINNFIEEYANARTPNPCIWCNSLIKFDVLPHLAKENGINFDKFATGHYARIAQGENGRYLLKRGVNPKKDQSYFLYRLRQDQLANIMLPLGDFTKEEIRDIAKKHGLEVAEKPDSQDFYEGDYNELLQVKDKIGNIVDTDGKVLGQHNGIWNYTIGQRKGLGIASTEPLYVLELRKDTNEVVVGFKDKTMHNMLVATKMNWISIENLDSEMKCKVKIRSTQEPTDAIIRPVNNGDVEVVFDIMQKSIAVGQSAVFYNDDVVIGGGIIDMVK